MAPHGWDSDRGRVLLTYGEPDGIDRYPHQHNRKPYEIWRYSSINAEFVFVDVGQTGTYRLVHSTALNEVSAPDWEAQYAAMHRQMYDGEFDREDY